MHPHHKSFGSSGEDCFRKTQHETANTLHTTSADVHVWVVYEVHKPSCDKGVQVAYTCLRSCRHNAAMIMLTG